MNRIMFPLVFAIMLLDLEILNSFSCERGNGKCCYGFVWDNVQEKCLPCKLGYFGQNCSSKCSFPLYGSLCTSQCNCSANDCDYVSGCRQWPTFKLTSTSTGNPSSTSTAVGKLVSAGTSSNSSCDRNFNASPNKKPLLVGIIVLVSMAFILILLTLYTYILELIQKSRIKQKENI